MLVFSLRKKIGEAAPAFRYRDLHRRYRAGRPAAPGAGIGRNDIFTEAMNDNRREAEAAVKAVCVMKNRRPPSGDAA